MRSEGCFIYVCSTGLSACSSITIWKTTIDSILSKNQGEREMMDSSCSTILFFFLLICANTLVGATDHIVGANRGWNPGINYTLWANNQTFYVGDLISFRYLKTQYNVYEVNETGYDNCTIEGAMGNWSSGKDFILLNKTQRYYFICGTGGCFNGMKVSVVVHALPSPPHAANHSSSESSGQAGFPPPPSPTVFGVLLALLASIWF